MKKYLIILAILVVGSCSIIEDDDILNEEDLGDLQLTSINLSDFTNDSGNRTIGTATITYSGDRISSIQWPPLDNTKIRMPRQNDPGGITTELTYDGNGRVISFNYLFTGGTDGIGQYQFTYDANGNIETITLDGDFTIDSLFYSGNTLTRINRQLGTIPPIVKYDISFQTSTDRVIVTSQNRTFDRQTFGDLKTVFGDFTNGEPGNVNLQTEIVQDRLVSLRIEDDRQDDFGNLGFFGNRNRFPDTFFVHPFLIFPDLFPNGELLAEIFFEDWWEINQTTDTFYSYDSDEYVEIDFVYER